MLRPTRAALPFRVTAARARARVAAEISEELHMSIDARLTELGITLPDAPAPAARIPAEPAATHGPRARPQSE